MCDNDNTLYYAYDYNFNNLSIEDFNIICTYRLPILSLYPKLVLYIYNSPQFQEILNKPVYNENKIINKLIITVNKFRDEKNFNDIIDTNAEGFWDILINNFNESNSLETKYKGFKKSKSIKKNLG